MDKSTKLIFALLFIFGLSFLSSVQKEWVKSELTKDEKRRPAQALVGPPATTFVKKSTVTASSNFDELYKIKKCYDSQDCDFDQSDPKAHDFAVGKRIAQFLRDARLAQKGSPELQKVAREFIQSEDGFVQEAALEILKDSPSSIENLEAVVSGIKETTNPLMAEMGLEYLERYLGSTSEPKVHQALDHLLFGAHLVSISVSEKILNFINDRSYGFYAEKLKGMNPQTQAYRNLKSALKEFELQKSGG